MAKRVVKVVLLILAGFLVGSLVTGGLVALQSAKLFKSQYYAGINSHANVAYMIRADRQEELLKNIDNNVAQCVLAAETLYGKDEKRLASHWLIQRYYQKFGLPVPPEISPILESLPPRPLTSCELKDLDDAAQETDAQQAPTGDSLKAAPEK